MKNTFSLVPFFLLFLLTSCTKNSSTGLKDYAALVDPMIGTGWNGHTFPGAVMPYGMIQLSPDTKMNTWANCSGYHYSDSTIMGFSHTHYSGTGAGGGSDIMFMPTVGKIHLQAGDPTDPSSGYRSAFSHKSESAAPGYYKVLLDDYDVLVELTATLRVGFHKYTFPETGQANVILDLVHGNSDWPDSLCLQINDGEISGYRAASGGLDGPKIFYFTARFSRPYASYGLAVNDSVRENISSAKGKNVKAFFRFDTKGNNTVLLKIALSTVSMEGAGKNMETELPGWDFDRVRRQAREAWNKELNKIEVEGGTKAQRKIFYTAMYHSFIHPSVNMDVDKRFRSTNHKIYTAKDFDNYTNFSLWDTWRGLHPLQTLLNRKRTAQFIRTFLERYEHSGNMPVMEFSGNERRSMIGYHSLPVVADAYVKGIRDYNVEKAFEAMKHLADSYREGKKYYLQYGFIPFDLAAQSVSRTLEYSYDDWCVSRMAKEFDQEAFNRFNQRGKFYQNLFNREYGFMCPKSSNYTWLEDFNPGESTGHYTEANAYQYTPSVFQDIEGLIGLFGGDEEFETWLDKLFTTPVDTTIMTIADATGQIGQYAHGNEPSHHIAYLYNYVGAAWKTQEKVRQILTSLYFDKPGGISGNDDAGQMSAWYILSAMGFYSVTPGMDYFVIGSPLFDKITINLENGNKCKIIVKNNTPDHPYIQSMMLNGEKYTKSYITYTDIINGANIVFTMGGKPDTSWGKPKEDRPFSLKYVAAPLPKITAKDRFFLDRCTVTLSCDSNNATIRYTLNGSTPDENAKIYTQPLKLNKSVTLKANCYINGLYPGYPATQKFKKVTLQPAEKVNHITPGLRYVYREGFCESTAEIKKYPVLNTGIISTFNIDSIKDTREFSYQFSGYLNVPEDGLYTFYLESNDGATFFLDHELVIDNDGGHPAQALIAKAGLKKGLHPVRLNYFQMGRAKKLVVKWSGPDFSMENTPADALFH
ncbi:MAG: glycoside hydrolase family 92 protein [Chlorobi bacterium]|nr:glycoside hydrolase family 92 protein [Chlorobiota bacterium]